MPASQFAKDVTSATIDFWATTANGTSLGSHAAGLAESAQQNEIQGLTTRIQTIGDIVQTTDSLIRPVIQLATIDNASIANTGWGAAGKVLKGAGTAAMFTSWLADTASLQDTLADLKATDAQKQSKFEAWLLGTGAFVIGVGALAASAPALVAVLGVTAMGLTVASIIAEKNTGSVNAPLLRSMRSGLTDLFQGVRKATNEAPAYLHQLKADIVGFGADVAGAGRKYAQRYAAVIEAEVNRFSGSPVTYLKDLAGSAYAYISQNLSDGSAYVARLIGAVIDGETDQFTLKSTDSGAEQSVIIVTANRRTGATSFSFQGQFAILNQSEVGAAMAAELLELARAGKLAGLGSGNNAPQSIGALNSISDLRAAAGAVASTPVPVVRRNADGTITIGSVKYRAQTADKSGYLTLQNTIDGTLSDFAVVGGQLQLQQIRAVSGGVEVVRRKGEPVRIKIGNNPLYLDFANAGDVLGSTLGRYIAGSNQAVGVVSSALLQTVGANLGDVLNQSIDFDNEATSRNLKAAMADIPQELTNNIKAAGIGAVSSYLSAELIRALGVSGLAAGVGQTASSAVLGQIVSNLSSSNTAVFNGVNPALLGNAIGSFLGSKLASELVSFDTIGGQLGSSVGSSLASIALGSAIGATNSAAITATLAGTALPSVTGIGSFFSSVGPLGAAGGPIGLAAAAFIGFLAGGLLGSVFGGTPRSGADVLWDPETRSFEVANAYKKKGGSLEAAVSMASSAAGTFNMVLNAIGGKLSDPAAVQAGNYGMRKKEYVYRAITAHGQEGITQRFSGKVGAASLVNYGVFQGLADPDFKIIGGDLFLKRALYNGIALANGDVSNFDTSTIVGNLDTAAQYEQYLLNGAAINSLIAGAANSVFSAQWAIVLQRSIELGLNRRAASDWYGGFGQWMQDLGVGPANVGFRLDWSATSGKPMRTTKTERGVLGDSIEVASQDIIQGSTTADVIRLSGTALLAGSGTVNTSLVINGVATDGTAREIAVAATIDAGAGNDTVYGSDRGDNILGGLGDDTLVGGKLDDWLLGGDGNDRLFAGAVTTTAFADTATAAIDAALVVDGGSGNYLDGGVGDDRLYGSTGSDWLVGDEGSDYLYGGSGGDILHAGKGNDGSSSAPGVRGGSGSDQYVFNRGDGQDVYFDEAGTTGPGGFTGDSISAAVKARTAGSMVKNWAGGGEFTVDGSTKGGEDAIAFGADITMFHLLLERSGTAQAPGMDLIIKIQRTDGTWSAGDDQITIRDWFEGTRRIEWLRFANGEELRLGDFTSFQRGTAGADVIIGTAGNDFQYGDDGDDNMWGLAGNDWQVGGRGNDAVRGNDDNDVVLGGDDDDVVLGGIGADTVMGDDGNDRVYGGTGNDLVVGGRGDDEVAGGAGDDVIKFNRGDGRDTLFDEFAGTWELVWRDGAYTNGYAVDANGRVTKGGVTYNDGTTWIGRYDYNEAGGLKSLYRLVPPASGPAAVNSGTDVLEFGVGIDVQDLVFRQDGNDLRIAITRSAGAIDLFDEVADQIRIKDWYAAAGNGRSIEKFEFVNTGEHLASAMTLVGGSDGVDVLAAAAGTPAWITGGAGDDSIIGTDLADILSGNSGADLLNGAAGADILYGGDGDDTIIGGAGADVIVGGSGADTASYVGAAALTVFLDAAQGTSTGDAAGDTFVAVENLTGSANADTLYGDVGGNLIDGGAGNDMLYGGAGDDIYQLYVGGGSDTITDRVMSRTTVVAGAAGDDTIELGEGLSFASLVLARVGNDLTITIGATADRIVIKDHFATAEAVIESLVTADGAAAPLAGVLISTTGTVAGTTAGELLFGRADAADTLDGGAGNDVLSGSSGNDTLRGGDGDDVLEGGVGADTLDGGRDTISSGGTASAAGNGDTARYASSGAFVTVNLATRAASGGDAEGDVIALDANGVSTIENVVGSASGDTLTGDARANMLVGLAGNDTLTGGSGDDVLIGGDGADVISGDDGADNIDAGEGDDVSVRGGAGADLIAGGGGNDVLYGDAGTDTLDGGTGNDTLWGGADADTLGGGQGADTLQGEAGDDKLSGGAGNDTLVGGDGADVLSGDAGDDSLQGGLGNDTYAFDANAGSDTIIDASGVNRIAIAGATREQVWLTKSGNDLKVGVIGGTTRLTVSGYFSTSGASLMREIAVGDSSLYLKFARPLIDAMTAAGAVPPASIAEISATIAAARDPMWWTGGKAAPSAANFVVSTSEDVVATGTLAVVDHDENITAYVVVTQASKGTVTVNTTTGAWRYTPNANYNGPDSFVLSARDADGQSVKAQATVTVVAVNDAPTFGTTPTLAVNENAANGTSVATLTATDVEGSPVVFSIADVNSPFAISTGGVLTVRDGSKLNFEAGATAVVNVTASDGQQSVAQAFTVKINNLPEAPNAPVISGAIPRVSEPASGSAAIAGTTIATLTATDPDGGTAPNFRIRSAPSGVFAVTGNALTFSTTYVPNFETIATSATLVDRDADGLREVEYSVDIESWDGGLASAAATRVTVGIEDTNEAPVAINFTSPTIAERDRPVRNAVSTAVSLGQLGVTDPDLAIAGESHIYSVTDTRFEIVNGTELRLKAGQALDYESAGVEAGTNKRYLDLAITVKDRGGVGAVTKSLTQTKRIYISDVDDYLYGTTGNDNGAAALVGQSGRDIIEGVEGDDEIYGGLGNDVIYGGNGADTLRGGAGSDTYYGGEGSDSIVDEAEAVADIAEGGAGNDTISLGGGDDTLRGDAGDDRLYGGTGLDSIEGGDGADWMYGEDGNDIIQGGAGDDYLSGGAGADRLEGGLNFDYADYSVDAAVKVDWDTPGANTGAAVGDVFIDIEGIAGSSSGDILLGRNAANDVLKGRGGNDELDGRGGQDTLYGGAGADRILGGAGHDTLFGEDGNDTLEGGADNDYLSGAEGADTLQGDAGFDRIDGGKGDDLLVGGAGSDTYIIRRGDGADRIDQTGALAGDRDLIGFTDGLTNRNLWFEWTSGDVVISVLGSAGIDNSVRLLGYSALGRSNVESVIAADQQLKTKDLAIGLLATTMDRFVAEVGYRPATQTQFDALYANTSVKIDGLTFRQHWDNFWSANEAPTLSILNAVGWNTGWQEDQFNTNPYMIQVRLADDQGQVPNLSFEIDEVATEGSKAVDQQVFQSFTVNRPTDENGFGSIAVSTRANASGTRWLWIRTTDAGGLRSERWVPVTVNAVADAPSVTRAESPGGNAGSWIPVIVEAAVTDAEARVGGAEFISVIGVHKLPSELQFNKGWRRNDGVWILSHGELAGLHVLAPAGWSRDLTGSDALVFDVWSQEPGNGATALTSVSVPVRINGTPSAPVLSNGTIAENQPANSVVGQLVVNDPDRLENNPFSWDTSSVWWNESRWIGTIGPQGTTITALQTGQMDTENGGGVHSNGFVVDPSKAYKFSVFVRADSAADTRVYFGVAQGGYVENATSGGDDGNPYFMFPVQNELTPGRWYRLEGYVLPQGGALVDPSAYGGIFDVQTGAKVANAYNVYRWNDVMPSTTVHTRFFNYYGNAQGFSTSWYQPVVEQLPTFTLTGGSNVSVDAAGVVRLTTSADYEAVSSYPFSVTATDAGGLSSAISTAVTISPVNETPYITGGTGDAIFSETGLGGRPANTGVTVATIGVADPDGTTPNLEFVSNPNGWFYIDQATKQIRFNAGLDFNFEWFRNAAYGLHDRNGNGWQEVHVADVWVRASDGSLLSNNGLVQVFIENVAEAPINLRPDRYLNVNEDAGYHGFAWMVADDPDGQALTYTLVDGLDGGGRFSLRSDGLLIANGGYNFEDANGKGYTIRVRATDPNGLSTTGDYGVVINNVNERPNNLLVEDQNYFPETQGGASHDGALIARFNMSDPDGPAPELNLLNNPNGWFKTVGGNHLAFNGANFTAEWIRSNLGQHGVEGGYWHDRDGDGAYEVKVATVNLAAKDTSGATSDPFGYDVFIEDANEAPYVNGASFWVAENSPGAGNTPVGTISWGDPDASPKFRNPTFAITSGNDSGMFSINQTSGTISLQGALNYEGPTTAYNLGVTATDAAGASGTGFISVYVTDVNEAPQPYYTYGRWIAYYTQYQLAPNDPDDSGGFVVSNISSSNASWTVSASYNSSVGRIVVDISDGDAPWNSSSFGTVYLTVTDKNGSGASSAFQFNTRVQGYKPKPGEHEPHVIFDLDGDGVELVPLATSNIRFDMDGDGARDRTGWVGADDAFLVLDKNANGVIDNTNEFSFAADSKDARSDLEGLRAYDSSENGFFDSGDADFARFQIWQDVNQDGISQKEELTSLDARGIVGIRLELDETGASVVGAKDNVVFANSEAYRRNGSTMDVADVFLAYRSSQAGEPLGSGLTTSSMRLDKSPGLNLVNAKSETVGAEEGEISFFGFGAGATAEQILQPAARPGAATKPIRNSKAVNPAPAANTAAQAPTAPPLSNVADTANSGRAYASDVGDTGIQQAEEKAPSALAAMPASDPVSQDGTDMRQTTAVAPSVAAQRAAAILRGSPPQALSSFKPSLLSGQSGATIMAQPSDIRVDRLIAAMGAFQGGERIGAGDVMPAPPVDDLLAQLAPAI